MTDETYIEKFRKINDKNHFKLDHWYKYPKDVLSENYIFLREYENTYCLDIAFDGNNNKHFKVVSYPSFTIRDEYTDEQIISYRNLFLQKNEEEEEDEF